MLVESLQSVDPACIIEVLVSGPGRLISCFSTSLRVHAVLHILAHTREVLYGKRGQMVGTRKRICRDGIRIGAGNVRSSLSGLWCWVSFVKKFKVYIVTDKP